jgi:hypothetical protein
MKVSLVLAYKNICREDKYANPWSGATKRYSAQVSSGLIDKHETNLKRLDMVKLGKDFS